MKSRDMAVLGTITWLACVLGLVWLTSVVPEAPRLIGETIGSILWWFILGNLVVQGGYWLISVAVAVPLWGVLKCAEWVGWY